MNHNEEHIILKLGKLELVLTQKDTEENIKKFFTQLSSDIVNPNYNLFPFVNEVLGISITGLSCLDNSNLIYQDKQRNDFLRVFLLKTEYNHIIKISEDAKKGKSIFTEYDLGRRAWFSNRFYEIESQAENQAAEWYLYLKARLSYSRSRIEHSKPCLNQSLQTSSRFL